MNNIRNQKLMRELLYYLMSNFTSLYSYKKIGHNFSTDFSTVKEYIGYLEASRAFFEVPIFSYSLKTQSRNNKKVYCIDNGLLNIVVLGDLNKIEIITNLYKAYEGTHLSYPKIESYKGKEIFIEAKEEVLLNIDGESAGKLPAYYKILPERLPVLVL